MKPKLENLFVYGTLHEPEVQLKIIDREVAGTVNRLPEHRPTAIHIDGDVFQGIERKIGSWVTGNVLSVTPEELKKIDEYETSAYRREKRILADGTEAYVYIPVRTNA